MAMDFPVDGSIDLKGVAAGDQEAFRRFYEQWSGRVYAFGLKLLQTDVLAEELMQEVFLRVWQHRARLEDINDWHAYFWQIVRNQGHDMLKRIAREAELMDGYKRNMTTVEASTEAIVLFKESQELFDKGLNTLTPKQREVYLLCKVDGLSYEEAANRLALSPLTVKTHMQHALRKMQTFMQKKANLTLLLGVLARLFSG